MFGKRGLPNEKKEPLNETTIHYKIDIGDNHNHRELVKIGREIERFKKLDGGGKKEIQRRFGTDANRLMEKKSDDTLIKNISREVAEQLKRR